jgi:hypothetical protein
VSSSSAATRFAAANVDGLYVVMESMSMLRAVSTFSKRLSRIASISREYSPAVRMSR